MSRRGSGDRWLAGELPDGVVFGHHAPVEITDGRFRGRRGRVALLMELSPEPVFLVSVEGHDGGVRVRQSVLRHAD